MSQIKLTLDKRRVKTNGTYPLVFRITANGDSRDIKTSYSFKEVDWNDKSCKIKSSVVGVTLIEENSMI
jgi:hypothetical protein